MFMQGNTKIQGHHTTDIIPTVMQSSAYQGICLGCGLLKKGCSGALNNQGHTLKSCPKYTGKMLWSKGEDLWSTS